jgi:hypothetical protein
MEWETTDHPSASLDDDLTLVELLFEKPHLLGEDLVLIGEARGTSESGLGGRIVVGWRRAGGPLVLGVTTGSGSEALLVEAIGYAGTVHAWTLARWSEEVRRYWDSAPPELVERIAARWVLPAGAPWDVAAWTRAGWGEEPREGLSAIALLATRIPESCARAITWLARRAAIAAFRIRWYGADATPEPRIEKVAGDWKADSLEPEAAGAAQTFTIAEAASAVDAGQTLVTQIESMCAELGCRISRRGEGWIRIDGMRRSLRAFPDAGWLDLQLVGIDEGSLVGLAHRYGVPLRHEPPSGAPPGIHLRLEGEELDSGVRALLAAWLGGGPGAPSTRAHPSTSVEDVRSRRPRNPGSRPKHR